MKRKEENGCWNMATRGCCVSNGGVRRGGGAGAGRNQTEAYEKVKRRGKKNQEKPVSHEKHNTVYWTGGGRKHRPRGGGGTGGKGGRDLKRQDPKGTHTVITNKKLLEKYMDTFRQGGGKKKRKANLKKPSLVTAKKVRGIQRGGAPLAEPEPPTEREKKGQKKWWVKNL